MSDLRHAPAAYRGIERWLELESLRVCPSQVLYQATAMSGEATSACYAGGS